jgi:predicted Rdx family selenoprotein
MFYWNCFFKLIWTYFNLIHFYAVDVQNVFVNEGGTVVLQCTCQGDFQWVRGVKKPKTGIIENGKAKDYVADHIRIPSMKCHDLEVSNITQTDEQHYKCLCENGTYVYKLNISGK